MFAPRGANSPPARRSRAIRIHFGGLRPSKPLTAGAGGRPDVASGAVRRGAFLASEGRSKRLRAACRASPAPMAQAVGAGTRLPRQERAHDGHILGYTVPNATRHAIPHHNAHIYPRIYRATHRHKPPPPVPSRVSRILWTLETLTCSGPVQPRPPWRERRARPSAAACHEPRFLLPSVARNTHSSASRPHPFAAKTAHATASVGWVWDPPVSERRPSPYRAQHEPRPLQAVSYTHLTLPTT